MTRAGRGACSGRTVPRCPGRTPSRRPSSPAASGTPIPPTATSSAPETLCTPIPGRCSSSHRPSSGWRTKPIGNGSETRTAGFSPRPGHSWSASSSSTPAGPPCLGMAGAGAHAVLAAGADPGGRRRLAPGDRAAARRTEVRSGAGEDAATLLGFSSFHPLYYGDMVATEGLSDLFAVMLTFHAMVVFTQEGRFRQPVVKTCAALLLGEQFLGQAFAEGSERRATGGHHIEAVQHVRPGRRDLLPVDQRPTGVDCRRVDDAGDPESADVLAQHIRSQARAAGPRVPAAALHARSRPSAPLAKGSRRSGSSNVEPGRVEPGEMPN